MFTLLFFVFLGIKVGETDASWGIEVINMQNISITIFSQNITWALISFKFGLTQCWFQTGIRMRIILYNNKNNKFQFKTNIYIPNKNKQFRN